MSVLVQGARVVLRRCTVLAHCAAPVQPSREAGHSHWHNIRHIKEANDSLRQKEAIDIVRKIKVAVQEGGSTNPKLNSALARVLEEGKSKDVSSTTMLDSLKRMEKKGAQKGAQTFVEGQGIANSSLIIEAHTEKAKWLRQQIQHVLKQYGGRTGDSGTASRSFTFKGVVYTRAGEGVQMDDALEAAIEAGAEDVRLVDGDTAFQVRVVREALEGRGFKVQEARQEYLPHVFVRLDPDTLTLASKMLDQLDAIEDVTRVYDNIEAIAPES